MAAPSFLLIAQSLDALTSVPFDVSLEAAFSDGTATLELNPGSSGESVSVELRPADVRVLRDALDRLLGETRATVPFTDEDNASPAPTDADLAVLGDASASCPDCGGGGEVTVCPPRCDGSHVMDTPYRCTRCAGTGEWREPVEDVDDRC